MIFRCLTLLGGCLSLALATEPQPFPLWPGDAPANATDEMLVVRKHANRDIQWITKVRWPTLTVYPAAADKATGAAVIICPGGGYGGLAYDMEGIEVAQWFAAHGVTGVVLKYRMPRPTESIGQVPWPIQDGQRAVQTMRARAAEWKLKSNKIGICGFSAGGHLAATVSTHVINADVAATDPILHVSSRPDFSVLIYPVITFDPLVGHSGSSKNLIGPMASKDLVSLYNNDQQVTASTPPAFLAHAADDGVKVENSERYAAALKDAGIVYEFARFDTGGHGFGLGIHGGDPATWPDRCIKFLTPIILTSE